MLGVPIAAGTEAPHSSVMDNHAAGVEEST
jgi:hypothetical protein